MDKILHNKSLDNNQNKELIYNQWADTYEDYVRSIGYRGPENVVRFFKSLYTNANTNTNLNTNQNKRVRVLDFGCGTGLLGEELFKSFKGNIELIGIDISDNMIEKAREKNVYTELLNLNLVELDLDVIISKLGAFDYIISCGVFLEGHVSFNIFDKLKKLVKNNIIFTVRESFMTSRYDEFTQFVKISKNYEEHKIEYLNNVECKLIII